MMLSNRFVIPVILCFCLAIIPTVIHNYMGLKENDGKTAVALPRDLGNYVLKSARANTAGIQETFDSDDNVRRVYMDTVGNEISLFVIRSYDHKKLYHHPEAALSYGSSIDSINLQFFSGSKSGDVPVRVLEDKSRREIVGAYALIYGDSFVTHPIRRQLLDSLRLLVSARKKMTLFYVSGVALPRSKSVAESSALDILMRAMERFQEL